MGTHGDYYAGRSMGQTEPEQQEEKPQEEFSFSGGGTSARPVVITKKNKIVDVLLSLLFFLVLLFAPAVVSYLILSKNLLSNNWMLFIFCICLGLFATGITLTVSLVMDLLKKKH